MGTYSYIVSRFVPNQIRDEAINIGIIAVDPDTGKTAHRFMDNLRSLRARCPGVNLRGLENIVGSIQVSDMPGGVDDLERLADIHTYTLQFTEPRAAAAPTLKDALRDMFDTYVGEAAAAGPAPARAAARKQLLVEIDAEAVRSEIVEEAAIPRPEFVGSRGIFRPDRAFHLENGAIALHALSFAAQPWRALKDAKVLAVDYEDAAAKATAGLECAAIVDPPPGDGNPRGREMYEQAAGHLKDRDCEVVPAGRMPVYVRGVARRVGRAGKAKGRTRPRSGAR